VEPSSLHLALDIGNTRTKAALFTTRGMVRWTTLDNGDGRSLVEWLAGVLPTNAVLGSVAAPDPGIEQLVAGICPILAVDGNTDTPLRNRYVSLRTLGADRLANAVGASCFAPGRTVLVIDAGTCITYDLVSAQGDYLGGAISPGMRLRAKAMHDHSARLPLVEPGSDPAVLGVDTLSSLASGIHHGILGEVRGFMAGYAQHNGPLVVLLTGGDGLWIARGLKSGIFAHPLLTLEGLHAILQYNLLRSPADNSAGPTARSGSKPAG
jgi:type III pantothenate kinase